MYTIHPPSIPLKQFRGPFRELRGTKNGYTLDEMPTPCSAQSHKRFGNTNQSHLGQKVMYRVYGASCLSFHTA